ncbi:GNAT family N-acetyltransferase [Mucilaginibacter sp. UR6-11]|uniref:GNAT family N-acetyltransferase n=1 Tax=Mucilaginibacter sp. UR6-11 TaxID=1435644 RepID=UPI001E3A2C48|nr:GNAT family N-acetyltransferase [Mucilaginibacter sp. UR6-11]MCC8427175.1 GNAT family N-acetyltransferase [Mucilaginibacter sp. UR6-11]
MTSTQKAYTIKRLSVFNITHLASLYQAVYKRSQAADFFQKKYDTAYTGAQYIGFIAYNQLYRPIAYYGVIPTLLWYDGHTILAAQSADTMTHPDYRNMGLFTELANQTYALCKDAGIRLVFGFPNQNSLPGLMNKLNWHTTGTMDRFMIPVGRVINLERIARRFPFLRPGYRRYQRWVLKPCLQPRRGIANSVLADGFNGVFRDDDYLRYKSYSPTYVVQINGSLFWIKLKNGLHIGDIEDMTDGFGPTLKKLRAFARKLGISQIHFQASPQTGLHTLFAQYYQPTASYTTGFKNLEEGLPTSNIKFTFADIDIF